MANENPLPVLPDALKERFLDTIRKAVSKRSKLRTDLQWQLNGLKNEVEASIKIGRPSSWLETKMESVQRVNKEIDVVQAAITTLIDTGYCNLGISEAEIRAIVDDLPPV